MLKFLILSAALSVQYMAQQPRVPNTELQRTAMKKLSFLMGKWSGEVRLFRGSTEPVEMLQMEKAEYKLDSLLLTIEGTGRNKSDGKLGLQAFGIVSYDDEAGTYRMRAFNDGRWFETEMKLAESGKELTWGFALGEIKTHSILRIDDKGEWTELHEITIGSQPPRKFMELKVRPEN
jgi:muconolactone delta-isomerase